MIQYSPLLKEWFCEYQTAMEKPSVSMLQDLSLAKHRFNSSTKPTGRWHLTYEALVMTGIRVVHERRGTPVAKQAAANLLSITVKRIVCLGMLADAAHESLHLLTRFFDKEEADSALVASQIRRFASIIKILFIDGKALQCGFTKLAQDNARRVFLWYDSGGACHQIGNAQGISAEDLHDLISRMCAWVKISLTVVLHEYPHFELINCFQVFALSSNGNEET